MCASRPSFVGCSTRTVSERAPVHLGQRQDVERGVLVRVRDALVDLRRDEPLVRHDLAVLAVEADLAEPVGDHHVAPRPADAEVDLADRHLAAVRVPPPPHELRRRPRLPHEVLRRVELARDQDLLVASGASPSPCRYWSLSSPSSFSLSSSSTTSSWSNRSDQCARSSSPSRGWASAPARSTGRARDDRRSRTSTTPTSRSTRRCFDTCGWRDPELRDQIVDRALATGEDVEDLAPAGLGDGVERIGGRCCSCHERYIFQYRHMSSRVTIATWNGQFTTAADGRPTRRSTGASTSSPTGSCAWTRSRTRSSSAA